MSNRTQENLKIALNVPEETKTHSTKQATAKHNPGPVHTFQELDKLVTPPVHKASGIAKIRKPLPGRDVTRADLQTKIKGLLLHIRRELQHVSNLHASGRYDKAAHVCCVVANSRAKLEEYLAQLERVKSLDPVPAPQPRVFPSRSKVKVKKHKRWSKD